MSKVLRRVVLDLAEQRRIDRKANGGGHHDRVAVGWRPGDSDRAKLLRSTGLVLDDHRLPQTHGELLADHAGHGIGRSARRVRHDDAHRFAGEIVGQRNRCADGQRRHGDVEQDSADESGEDGCHDECSPAIAWEY
jgi:hypothetical protein